MKYLAASMLGRDVAGPFCFSATAQKGRVGRRGCREKCWARSWRMAIRVRPDKGNEYAKLIETQGLPLFRRAGGRMVGWWTTAVGDLYEQVTIWEYDGMAAFEAGREKSSAAIRISPPLSPRAIRCWPARKTASLQLADFAVRPACPSMPRS